MNKIQICFTLGPIQAFISVYQCALSRALTFRSVSFRSALTRASISEEIEQLSFEGIRGRDRVRQLEQLLLLFQLTATLL